MTTPLIANPKKKSEEHITLLDPQSLLFKGKTYPCATGWGGITGNKQEGDGGTPVGILPLRRLFYRADRISKPTSTLETIPLSPSDGWCDDANDSAYNTFVTLPYPGRHEMLWLETHEYDIVIELGYNDNPIIPGKGSAIFMHLTEDYKPTQGCIALKYPHLIEILEGLHPSPKIIISSIA